MNYCHPQYIGSKSPYNHQPSRFFSHCSYGYSPLTIPEKKTPLQGARKKGCSDGDVPQLWIATWQWPPNDQVENWTKSSKSCLCLLSFYFSRHLQEIFLAREGLPMTFPFINVSERWIHGSDFKSPYQRIHENCAYQWNSENCVYIYILYTHYIYVYIHSKSCETLKTLRTLWDTYTYVYILLQYYIYIHIIQYMYNLSHDIQKQLSQWFIHQWIWFKGKSKPETIDFPGKYGLSCTFSLKPIHWIQKSPQTCDEIRLASRCQTRNLQALVRRVPGPPF